MLRGSCERDRRQRTCRNAPTLADTLVDTRTSEALTSKAQYVTVTFNWRVTCRGNPCEAGIFDRCCEADFTVGGAQTLRDDAMQERVDNARAGGIHRNTASVAGSRFCTGSS